jgi:hypothetical protein
MPVSSGAFFVVARIVRPMSVPSGDFFLLPVSSGRCPYRPADVRIVRPMSVSSGGCPYLAADACYIDSNTWYIQYSIFKQKALVCKGQRGGVIIQRSTDSGPKVARFMLPGWSASHLAKASSIVCIGLKIECRLGWSSSHRICRWCSMAL